MTHLRFHHWFIKDIFTFHLSNLLISNHPHHVLGGPLLQALPLRPQLTEAGGVVGFTGELGGVSGPEGVLAHHLSLGVAVAGVQAVGPAGYRLGHGDRRIAKYVPRVSLSYPVTETPRLSGPSTPLPSLALVVQTLSRALPDTPESVSEGEDRRRQEDPTWCRRGPAGSDLCPGSSTRCHRSPQRWGCRPRPLSCISRAPCSSGSSHRPSPCTRCTGSTGRGRPRPCRTR